MKLENIKIEIEKFVTKKGTNAKRVKFVNVDSGEIQYSYDNDLIKTLISMLVEI